MKKIEAVIKPFKLDEVKEALSKEGIQSIIISEVKGWDRREDTVAFYRGIAYVADRPKVRVEVMVEDEEVEGVTDAIIGVLRTGHLCDGQITILPVEEGLRIRTGEHWANAVNQRNGLWQGGGEVHRPHKERDRTRAA
jgi:nitrogen regulatory protein PII